MKLGALAVTVMLLVLGALTGCKPAEKKSATKSTPPKVAELLSRAQKGDTAAQFEIAEIYEAGELAPQNYNEALKWYRRAAGRGDNQASMHLGTMYLFGRGVKQDKKQATKWFTLAASRGNSYAQIHLGSIYELGDGVLQDYAEAGKWYEMAAAQKHPEAMIKLGWFYYSGAGRKKDRVRAHMWFNVSSRFTGIDGGAGANYRRMVANEMSAAQIAEAQKLARECQARNYTGC